MTKVEAIAPAVSVYDWERLALPEGYRAEVILGELVVTPAPSVDHGRVVARLVSLLDAAAPAGYGVAAGAEWRREHRGVVAMAPIPDLVVISEHLHGKSVIDPPLLAVEVLSSSDWRDRLANGMTRREGKLLDYAQYGLADYLEVDVTADPIVAVGYELAGGVLTEASRAEGDEVLRALRPFAFEFRPVDLVAPRRR
jgi:Uma2 family endonuclease